MKKRKLEEHSTPGGTGLPRAKMGSSSQRLSRKKPPMETRRNRKRKPQQEKWKTVASDTTDDQKQDSKWGHNLPGAIVPPLQQNNSPPSKDLGIQGFFGLLRTASEQPRSSDSYGERIFSCSNSSPATTPPAPSFSYDPSVMEMPMAPPGARFLCLLVLAVSEGGSREVAVPGCHLHPFNVTVRSDRQGTCHGSHAAQACVGHCESSAFPSRYSVLVASGYRHNITSISQCCTIHGLQKVKVQLQCAGNRSRELEIFTARACQCDMCRLSRF
ncbi:glycoprotein hormone alpha-2 isoform X2 [Octodon degus]|nr:glycoprotein hormone alpha-2 isoform X2 [Octodon degus]